VGESAKGGLSHPDPCLIIIIIRSDFYIKEY
jgi:hypothetical protein